MTLTILNNVLTQQGPQIFSYLEASDLQQCSAVSKAFHNLANNDIVWQELVKRNIITTNLSLSKLELINYSNYFNGLMNKPGRCYLGVLNRPFKLLYAWTRSIKDYLPYSAFSNKLDFPKLKISEIFKQFERHLDVLKSDPTKSKVLMKPLLTNIFSEKIKTIPTSKQNMLRACFYQLSSLGLRLNLKELTKNVKTYSERLSRSFDDHFSYGGMHICAYSKTYEKPFLLLDRLKRDIDEKTLDEVYAASFAKEYQDLSTFAEAIIAKVLMVIWSQLDLFNELEEARDSSDSVEHNFLHMGYAPISNIIVGLGLNFAKLIVNFYEAILVKDHERLIASLQQASYVTDDLVEMLFADQDNIQADLQYLQTHIKNLNQPNSKFADTLQTIITYTQQFLVLNSRC
ncbi:MAG: hypothetical protein K0S74_1251 [Chlamydiales bacterium]|jgi:hypothetical protein|nr:hypothetical protein [Chlamydiales bacterium]